MVHRDRVDQHAVERSDSAANGAESVGDPVLKATWPCWANVSRKPDQLCSAPSRQVLAEQRKCAVTHRNNTQVPRLTFFPQP
jgi:hypothetical protein